MPQNVWQKKQRAFKDNFKIKHKPQTRMILPQ